MSIGEELIEMCNELDALLGAPDGSEIVLTQAQLERVRELQAKIASLS